MKFLPLVYNKYDLLLHTQLDIHHEQSSYNYFKSAHRPQSFHNLTMSFLFISLIHFIEHDKRQTMCPSMWCYNDSPCPTQQ